MLILAIDPRDTLADLLADHDPLHPLNAPAQGLAQRSARQWSRGMSNADFRDTRATLVCTLIAVDSWGE
jgi:hypothetical protein